MTAAADTEGHAETCVVHMAAGRTDECSNPNSPSMLRHIRI